MYLSVREVAKRLSKSEETVKRWIRAGKYPNAIKISDKEGWKIPIADIDGQALPSPVHVQSSFDFSPLSHTYTTNEDKELVTLAFEAVTLTHPTQEITELLSNCGIKRTLEILLIMQQSPTKVKNPLGFIKRAIRENWTPFTLPQNVNRRIQNFNEKYGFDSTPLPNEFPFYNWLTEGEDE